MSATTTPSKATITPASLAAHLTAGEPITVLDVREDASWGIEAPSASTRGLPAAGVLADPPAVARELSGPVAVVVDPAPDAGFYVALAAELGDIELRAIALPGHTTDMTGLLVADRALVGGDSLFADGIARPDLQRGDPEGARGMARTLHATLHQRVLARSGEVVLLPGHDHPTLHTEAVAPTLAEVRSGVPELWGADPDEFAGQIAADLPPRPANYEAVIAVNGGWRPFDPELEAGGNSCSTR